MSTGRICECCRRRYVPHTTWQRFCSAVCRQKTNTNKRQRLIELAREQTRGQGRPHAE